MRPKDRALAEQLGEALRDFDANVYRLPGICNVARRTTLLEQLLESIHRVRFVAAISSRNLSPLRANPASPIFDPVRAAVLCKQQGQIEEAFWFVFILVHFGKHLRDGWLLAREIYGARGDGEPWTWARTSANPRGFREWLANHHRKVSGRFGNHRKYESLDPWASSGTGAVVESYVAWVRRNGSHEALVRQACVECDGDRRRAFDRLYHSMNVMRFGRMARFDYFTMLGKLGLAPIEPGSTYMAGATGAFAGGCLLFGTSAINREEMDQRLVQLGNRLGVGMQVIEDALCNWQKSPNVLIRFRG